MTRVLRFTLLLAFGGLAFSSTLRAQSPGRAGVRFGAGADISGGVAFGGQVDYTLFRGVDAFEVGAGAFGGKFEEDSNNGFNDYHEETNLLVIAALANYLFRHGSETGGPYFVAGLGVGGVTVEWREESPTDTSLGSSLPGGGSFQEEDGTVAGFILNAGIGHRLNEQVDIRAQVPTFLVAASDERESQVIPTFTVTVGIGF